MLFIISSGARWVEQCARKAAERGKQDFKQGEMRRHGGTKAQHKCHKGRRRRLTHAYIPLSYIHTQWDQYVLSNIT